MPSIKLEIPSWKLSYATREFLSNTDEDSLEFFHLYMKDFYSHNPDSREVFEKKVQELIKKALDEKDAEMFHYGGNPGWRWKHQKFPDSKD